MVLIMRAFIFKILCSFLICFSFLAPADKIPARYEHRAEHSADGTGLFYMGREVAHVCQGGEWLERPERELEENSELMVESLGLKSGEVVADVGAGTGYISRKLSKRVGEKGIIYAVEIQQEMLDILTKKAADAGIKNIKPILGTVDDPKLPAVAIDTILLVDVYHELDRPYEMVQQMCNALKPGGRIVFVEYRAEDPKVPIKPLHKMSVEQVKKEMSVQPLAFVESGEKLPWQHMIIFRKKVSASSVEPSSSAKKQESPILKPK
jgi:precorrin-6B methylase 2